MGGGSLCALGFGRELSYFTASVAVTRMGVRMVSEVSGGSSRQAEVSHPAVSIRFRAGAVRRVFRGFLMGVEFRFVAFAQLFVSLFRGLLRAGLRHGRDYRCASEAARCDEGDDGSAGLGERFVCLLWDWVDLYDHPRPDQARWKGTLGVESPYLGGET